MSLPKAQPSRLDTLMHIACEPFKGYKVNRIRKKKWYKMFHSTFLIFIYILSIFIHNKTIL